MFGGWRHPIFAWVVVHAVTSLTLESVTNSGTWLPLLAHADRLSRRTKKIQGVEISTSYPRALVEVLF